MIKVIELDKNAANNALKKEVDNFIAKAEKCITEAKAAGKNEYIDFNRILDIDWKIEYHVRKKIENIIENELLKNGFTIDWHYTRAYFDYCYIKISW